MEVHGTSKPPPEERPSKDTLARIDPLASFVRSINGDLGGSTVCSHNFLSGWKQAPPSSELSEIRDDVDVVCELQRQN